MKMPQKDNSRTGTHEYLKVAIEVDDKIEVLEKIILSSNADKDISHFDTLVVIGKGASNSQNLHVIEELASLLNAGIACSRPLVECGMFPYEKQVGQTGRTVTPKLYIGIGVSGSIQHMAGMINSEKIIAINSDSNAPIVKSADYSIIGDYAKTVPELINKIKSIKEAGI
jgi:electron transfer flavoprotein alpha subunit